MIAYLWRNNYSTGKVKVQLVQILRRGSAIFITKNVEAESYYLFESSKKIELPMEQLRIHS